MTFRRKRVAFVTYGASVLLVLLGLAWVTWSALRLEHQARVDAALHGRLLAALWRMESALSPIIARQAGWRYYDYLPFYPAERAYTRMFEEVRPGEVLVPSPLLLGAGDFALLHFQIGPENRLSSPQAPEGNMRDLAESAYVASDRIIESESRLDALAEILGARRAAGWVIGRGSIESLLEQEAPAPVEPMGKVAADDFVSRSAAAEQARRGQRWESGPVQTRGDAPVRVQEFDALAAAREMHRDMVELGSLADRVEGELTPVWRSGSKEVGPLLLWVRTVRVGDDEIVQGVWADWPRLRKHLLESVHDLLPEATLHPVYAGTTPATVSGGHLLASIPAVLSPGEVPVPAGPVLTPARLALSGTWLAALTAIGAVGILLRAWMDLAERRGRFVSAVTHELRTPLTTFRLYSELLADNMVRDEASRAEYLGTLKRESRRLASVVENVLEYARLGERGRPAPPEPIDMRAALVRLTPALRDRAERVSMRLEEIVGVPEGVRVRADEASLERIVLNLVDNACKYACEARDRRIVLSADRRGGVVTIAVRDFGPGVPSSERTSVFAAFHRTPRHANGPIEGLGLGLALAKGLARELGGDLTCETPHDGPGAAFVLTLPVARA